MANNSEETSVQNRMGTLQRPTSLALTTQVFNIGKHEPIEIIDLCTPKIETRQTRTIPVVMKKIESRSIIEIERCSKSDPRLSILPLFPTASDHLDSEVYPLLTNVPAYRLTPTELARRTTGAFRPRFILMHSNSMIPSFLHEKYLVYFGDLVERLKVDMIILDYNYTRLNKYIQLLIDEQILMFKLRPHEIQSMDQHEYAIALEFYLQFDIHLFYMKTCSFRYARPRSLHEGLFCAQEPEARYELVACGNCALCYPQYDMTYRTSKSIVEFSQAHQHTFVNGYCAILNCSASCQTRNIIYVLTCPCGKVDYVGSTKYCLPDRLRKHREHGNRIMHEFLFGQENITRNLIHPKTYEILRKDRMRLYQHSVRCPVAMQMFLDANPQYWRFVPMSIEEAQQPEHQSIQHHFVTNENDATNTRTKEECIQCLEAVPKPPAGYTFSNRQIVLQTEYFHKKRDQLLPKQDIDLYNASIVAVLPETCSDMFRDVIESLFITYANTSLNTAGNVLNHDQRNLNYPSNNPWLIRGDQWCQGLVRRPQPKPVMTSTDPTTTV